MTNQHVGSQILKSEGENSLSDPKLLILIWFHSVIWFVSLPCLTRMLVPEEVLFNYIVPCDRHLEILYFQWDILFYENWLMIL